MSEEDWPTRIAKKYIVGRGKHAHVAVTVQRRIDDCKEYHHLTGPPTILCKPVFSYGMFPGHKWTFFCPWCRSIHSHGVGPGHRVGHCCGSSSGPVLIESYDSPFEKYGYILALDPQYQQLEDKYVELEKRRKANRERH